MAGRARGTSAGTGGPWETVQQNSSLDWMLDSSHVNVGLWNDFDGRQRGAEIHRFRDGRVMPQPSSSLVWPSPPLHSFPPPHLDYDRLRRHDGRQAFGVEAQGLGDRSGEVKGSSYPSRSFNPSLSGRGSSSVFAAGGASKMAVSDRVRSRQARAAFQVLVLMSTGSGLGFSLPHHESWIDTRGSSIVDKWQHSPIHQRTPWTVYSVYNVHP